MSNILFLSVTTALFFILYIIFMLIEKNIQIDVTPYDVSIGIKRD